jgi:hypothetical protein
MSGVPGSQLLDPENLWRLLTAFTPENAITVNEAATTGSAWWAYPRRWALPSHARTGASSPSRPTEAAFTPCRHAGGD